MQRLRKSLILALFVFIALAACTSRDSLLNSERISRDFGSYGVDVLQANSLRRVSSLYSDSASNKVTRTFAVVTFTPRPRRAFADEHARIQAGGSIGAVFKAANWDIEKVNLFIGEMEVPAKYDKLATLMDISLPQFLASHVYVFVVRKDGRSYEYATIVELHHPAYLSVEDLREIYGEIVFDDSGRLSIDDYIDPAIWRN